MALQDVVTAARALNCVGDDTWPFEAAALGNRLDDELGDPGVATEVCRALISVAGERGCILMVGASASGDRLAAVASALAANGLRRATATQVLDGTVLVVDGLLATGWQIRQAARRARDRGAGRVMAAVVIDASDVDLSDEVDDLIILANRL
ncbi:MAG: hypothetical protein M3083_00660 [Actinomycetota bacterium]|nr:hypothetical protein [Actinomycetota bacterium]MDQ6945085.1 hypothetical protein [Actinomycetota bacterium]